MKERSLSTVCLRKLAIVLVLGLASVLTGCTGFFQPVNNGSGGSGGTGGTGGGSTFPVGPDYVFVGNQTAMTVTGYAIGTGTLGLLPNMPYNVGLSPSALVVHPSDKFLYVAGTNGFIYCYPINSNGSLGASTQTSGVAAVTTQAIDISPDGNWLFALDAENFAVDVYQINQTTGALSNPVTVSYGIANPTPAAIQSLAVKVAPSSKFVFASLGNWGDMVFSFNTSTGSLVNAANLPQAQTNTSDNAFAVDSTSSYLYIARTGNGVGLAAYSISSAGALTPLTGSPFAAGKQPTSVTLGGSGKYVYVANGIYGTISGYSIGPGGLPTPLTFSPYAYCTSSCSGGSQVATVGGDNSGNYILATSLNGGPDLTMFSFDTTVQGQLDIAQTALTGQSTSSSAAAEPAGAAVIALSH
jgi:6-phosphogluconolactonase